MFGKWTDTLDSRHSSSKKFEEAGRLALLDNPCLLRRPLVDKAVEHQKRKFVNRRLESYYCDGKYIIGGVRKI